MVGLLRRRWREHPSALAAVVAAVLVSLLVIAALRAFSAGIADASVRGAVAAARPDQRVIAVTLPLRPGTTEAAEAVVTRATAGITGRQVYAARLATSRGLAGGKPTDRIQLAEIPRIAEATRLTAGRWPAAPRATTGPLEIAVPDSVAADLRWQVGARAELVDLIDEQAEPTAVTVVGIYTVTDRASPLWRLVPIGLTGIERGDFTAYGPVLVPSGTLTSQTLMSWLVDLAPERLSLAAAGPAAGAADTAVEALEKSPDLRGATVTSGMGDVLRAAAALGERTGRVLLTPMLLVLLLGGAALALAAGQLALLREPETRLLRARGAGSGQLALLALVEGGGIVLASALGALLLAPVVLRGLARASAFPESASGYGQTLTAPAVWVAVVVGAVLALGVYVLASLRHGRLRVERADDSRGRVATLAAGAGLDLALLLLGGLGVVQLRRYEGSNAGASLDPLTLAAPALVVGGLCVLALRLIPLLARAGARVAAGGVSLGRAWAGWQVSRRMPAQAGSILLVLLCLTMGALAVSQQATVERSLSDQTDFEVGAPVRAAIGGELYADPFVPSQMAGIAGGPDRAMRALRQSVEVGGVRAVTLLAVDTRAGRVMAPRPDLLGGAQWGQLLAKLTSTDVSGISVAGRPRELRLTGRLMAKAGDSFVGDSRTSGSVILADAAGQWWSQPLTIAPGDGTRANPSEIAATLALSTPDGHTPDGQAPDGHTPGNPAPGNPTPDRHVEYPIRVIGLTVDSDIFGYLPEERRPELIVDSLTADGVSIDTAPLQRSWRGATQLLSVPLGDPGPVPVVMTRELARRATITVGSTFAMPMAGATRTARLVALVDQLPTATMPALGVLADFGVVQRAAGAAVAGDAGGVRQAVATEYWLNPADPAAARAAIAASPRLGAGLLDRADVLTERRQGSVNAGMRIAMGVVTGAAFVLAALGFAAATTAMGAVRRHEAVVLSALGYGPSPQRRVLLAERAVVVLLTAVVGIVAAALASWLVTPLLVSGDGHPQVPPVVVEVDWRALIALAGALVVGLVAIAALVVRRAGDVAAALRAQEHP